MVKKVSHIIISIIARVLIYGMCWAQVFHVEICRRSRIPKFKKQKSKYSILNIAPNDHKMTLHSARSNVSHKCSTCNHESQPFLSAIVRFPDNWLRGFSFAHMVQCWIWKLRKKIIISQKLKISKIFKAAFWAPLSEKKLQKFENVWRRFVEVALWNVHSNRVPWKGKSIIKNRKL